MVFSEDLSAAKGAITYAESQVRYRGLNAGGGWIRDPLDVPQNLRRALRRSTWRATTAQRWQAVRPVGMTL